MPIEINNTMSMVLPAVNPITQWYKNNPPFCQVVKLTSNTIPNNDFNAFASYSAAHSFVLNKGYKSTTTPFVNVSGLAAESGAF